MTKEEIMKAVLEKNKIVLYHKHFNKCMSDAMESCATQLKEESQRLREALTGIVKNWDDRLNEKEQLKHFEGIEYWSPATSMIESKFIAAAREALSK